MALCIESLWDGIEAIVFDAVGTLIEPSPPVAEVYAEAARRQGLDLDLPEVRDRFVRFFRAEEENDARGTLATDEAAEVLRWRRIVTNVLPDLPDPDRAFQELWDHFGRPAAWTSFPDVAPALRAARERGLPVGIASNFDARLRGVVAGRVELTVGLGPIVISAEVGYRKPHPRFFRAVCERFGLAPERILVVGDDLENDLFGAQRAGLRGIWLDRKGRGAEPGVPCARDLLTIVACRKA